MKKKIALFLAAALISAGLIVSCGGGDDDDETGNPNNPNNPSNPSNPSTPVVKFTVTFDPNGGTFSDGTTANKTVQVESGKATGFANWEDDLERGTDQFGGWVEDGTTTKYTSSTVITKDVTLKAEWAVSLFTFPDANTAKHTNFEIVEGLDKHGGFHGTFNEDGSITLENGGIRYRYPITPGFDYHDYDFVDVTYTASQTGKNDGDDIDGMVLKNFLTGDDYPAFEGGIKAGEDNVVTFELRKALAGGFAIQKWDSSKPDLVITITDITFKKGTRVNISFDTDGGNTLAGTYLVVTTKVGTYLPIPTRAGFKFLGWTYPSGITGKSDGDLVSANDTVDSSYSGKTLKATWKPFTPYAALNITFSDVSELTITDPSKISDVTLITDGAGVGIGYYQKGANYNWCGIAFSITLPDGATLGDYDYVSYTIEPVDGAQGWKDIYICALDSLSSGVAASNAVSAKVQNLSNSALDMKVEIDGAKAASFSGTFYFCINVGGGTSDNVKITNIKIAQEE